MPGRHPQGVRRGGWEHLRGQMGKLGRSIKPEREEGRTGNDAELRRPAEAGKMEKRACLGDSQGEKTGISGEGWSGGRGKGLKPGRQRRHPVLPNQPPIIPESLLATSHIPKQGCSGWDQDGEAEVKGRIPAGRGLELCSQGQSLRDQDGSQNFDPQTSTIPSIQRLKQVQERRGAVSPAPSRGLGKEDGLKFGFSGVGPGRTPAGAASAGGPGPRRRGRHLQSS